MLTSYIIGSWSLVVGLGLLILGIVNIELPSFQEEVLVVTNIDEITKTSADKQQAKNNSWLLDHLLLFCGILFVFFMSGIDILFQSHIYIFGLCGPLKLSAQHAGWLNTVYFVSFLNSVISNYWIHFFSYQNFRLQSQSFIFLSIKT